MVKSTRGFTIVELIVVIIIISILLVLGFISLGPAQVQSRDKDREGKANALARAMELRYADGNTTISTPTTEGQKGSYPSVAEAKHINGDSVSGFTPAQVSGGYRLKAYPGTTEETFKNPSGTNGFKILCDNPTCPAGTVAGNASSTQITNSGVVTTDTYLYQPIKADGTVCQSGGSCVRFNIYWRREFDNQIQPPIKSKRQQ